MNKMLFVSCMLGVSISMGCTPKSKPGESCAKTADCESQLKCIKLVCIDIEKEKERANQRCRESQQGCKVWGRCTAVEFEAIDGADKCIAATDSDCRQSTRCRKLGSCTIKNGKCIVGSNSDCSQSENCKKDGLCTARNGNCAHGSDADCRKYSYCKMTGRCRFFNGQCKAGSVTDCKQSSWCRSRGHCYYRPSSGICRNGPCAGGECIGKHNCYGKCVGGERNKEVDTGVPSRTSAPKRKSNTDSKTSQQYYIDIFNIDDHAYVSVNEKRMAKVSYGQAKRRFPINNYLKKGINSVRFVVINDGEGYTWGFRLWRGNQVLWSEIAGKRGVRGANNNDQKTGKVFDKSRNVVLQ